MKIEKKKCGDSHPISKLLPPKSQANKGKGGGRADRVGKKIKQQRKGKSNQVGEKVKKTRKNGALRNLGPKKNQINSTTNKGQSREKGRGKGGEVTVGGGDIEKAKDNQSEIGSQKR